MDTSFLTAEYLTANWLPLLIAVIIGFILGWLLTGISPRRKNAQYESQIADLTAKARKSDRDLADALKQADSLKSSLSNAESKLDDTQKELESVKTELQTLTDDKASLEGDLQSRNIEIADLKMQLALLQDQYEKASATSSEEALELRRNLQQASDESQALQANLDASNAEIASLTAARDAAVADYASLKASTESALASLSSKDSALNEAFSRAANLQKSLEDRENALNANRAELEALKLEVKTLSSIKDELEERLQSARGEVASEMAVLTSTMIKMKEDALTSANARIAELTSELNALKSRQAAG